MPRGKSIGRWFLRLVAWDGVLPAAIWSAPLLVRATFPDNRAAIELTAVVLSVVAFLVRYRVGKRYISSNDCGAIVRLFQLAVFCIGILVLVVIDAVMVLTHVMPRGAAFATTGDIIVWGALYGTYITAMAFAMYPGSRKVSEPSDAGMTDRIPDISADWKPP